MQRLKLGINVGNIHIKARSRWRSPPKKNRSWNATSLDPIGTHDPTWKQNTSEWYRQRIRARPRNEAPAAGAEASVSTGDLNLPPNVTFYNKWRRRREREREAEFCQCDGHWEFIQIQRERERDKETEFGGFASNLQKRGLWELFVLHGGRVWRSNAWLSRRSLNYF